MFYISKFFYLFIFQLLFHNNCSKEFKFFSLFYFAIGLIKPIFDKREDILVLFGCLDRVGSLHSKPSYERKDGYAYIITYLYNILTIIEVFYLVLNCYYGVDKSYCCASPTSACKTVEQYLLRYFR